MLAPWIISHFPKHRIYTEVYGGAASVLLRKPRAYAEVYNDLDGEIVNFFSVLRDSGQELRSKLALTPFAREEFLDAYDPAEDPVEKARRTVIKSYMGFGSDSIKRKSGFRSNSDRSGTTPAHDWANYGEKLDELVGRMQGVVIEQRPALQVLKSHDRPDALHYVDPPYLHSTRTGVKNKAYRFEMTDRDHIELSRLLHRLKGSVVISGYRSPLYDKLYRRWTHVERKALADGARKRIEVLWIKPISTPSAEKLN
jgi:DNA adenine methylase